MQNQITIPDLIDRLKAKLVFASARVNDYATARDVLRNHVNYGVASQSARVLCILGRETFIHFWEDEEGFLRIENLVIDGKETPF